MKVKSLENEVQYLAHFFFKKEVNDLTVKRYQSANETIFSETLDLARQQSHVDKLVNAKVDLEAIEYAWRIKNQENILSKKMQILFYLLESNSDFYPTFINPQDSHYKGIFSLITALFTSIYKLLKGKLLLGHYEIL